MSLMFGRLFQPFVAQRPICVMARCVLENLLNPQRLDALPLVAEISLLNNQLTVRKTA